MSYKSCQNCSVRSVPDYKESVKLGKMLFLNITLLLAGGLERFEVPAAVKLVTEVWSPDMGLVTAAFKIKRKDIQERYKDDIKRMYAS